MKRLLLPLLIAAFIFAACDESSGPSKPQNGSDPEPSDYSGLFDIDYTTVTSGCSWVPPYPDQVNITITDDQIVFGSLAAGTWVEADTLGYGSSGQTCITIYGGCIGCYTVSFDIKYANTDSFSGTYTVDFTYNDECQADDCTTEYSITGVRY